MEEVDVFIVGAGAAGLMAACTIVNSTVGSGLSVRVFERQEKAGSKILASGNGRCNLGHSGSLAGHYRGADPDFVLPVFKLVDEDTYAKIFRNLGVLLVEDEAGRLYPRTMRSDTVQTALLNASAAKVKVDYGIEVFDIKPANSQNDSFVIRFRSAEIAKKSKRAPKDNSEQIKDGQLRAKTVIIASGGKSQPQLSGHESGYTLAEGLGHSRTELYPVLVPLELEDAGRWKRSSGQRVRAEAYYLSRSGISSPPSAGEFLFTDYGVSGIAAMELAEAVVKDPSMLKGDLIFDLLPEMSEESLSDFILSQIKLHPDYSWEELLIGLLPQDILIILLRNLKAEAEIEKTKKGSISIARAMKNLSRPVRGTRGFKFAQLTAGGISTDEVNPETMESKICPRLFLCGEILDVNGDTGGYNLRWAFSSAYVAGKSAAAACNQVSV
ncbi:MAG: aminoacetone oxidase family FAD-binding enzyme [Eubacteriales bacterium]|nr:aminoacetone oxidase family FAD-binding enzyme [Eubacteriales bacterium]